MLPKNKQVATGHVINVLALVALSLLTWYKNHISIYPYRLINEILVAAPKALALPAAPVQNSMTEMGGALVHCREDYVTSWLSDIPPSWELDVYENCGRNVSRRSIQFQNAGSEECTAYLDYIIRNYDNLPLRNMFLQSDTFRGLGKVKPHCSLEITGHSPFRSVSEMSRAIRNVSVDQGRQFVHFGWGFDRFMYPEWGGPDGYTKNYTNELLEDIGWNFTESKAANIRSRPGAVFVVHRDRILAHARSTYIKVKDKILADRGTCEARRRCCAMETSWHAMFGEPARLPSESTVDYLYSGKRCCGIMNKEGKCSDPAYPYAS